MKKKEKGTGKIRLLYLIGELGLGGSERQLFLLLKNLDRDLFESHIIVFNPSGQGLLNEALLSEGVMIYPVLREYRSVSARIRYLYRVIRKLKPHVIHSWSLHDNPYAGVVGLLARVPVRIGSVRSSLLLTGFRSLPPLYKWLSLHSVQGQVVNSEVVVKELEKKGIRRTRIFILPNCVEYMNDVSPADLSSIGIEEGHRVVGIVANLRRVKNHILFIEGMAQILRQFPDVTGLIVGQPIPQEPDQPVLIQKRIEALGMKGRIILAGFRPDIPAILRRLSIFCLTSDSEGMPNALMEAMSAGIPVVATRVGAVEQIVEDGVSGFLINPGDVQEFVRKVNKLLHVPDMAERMGKAGRSMMECSYRCPAIASRLKDFYLEALKS